MNSASNIRITGNTFTGYPVEEQVVLGQNNDCATILIDGMSAC